jgi:hypothetical protein
MLASVPDFVINKPGNINDLGSHPDVKTLHTSDSDLWHVDWQILQK